MKIKTTKTRPLPVRHPSTFPIHEGRQLIVTGAARGLGKALAELLQNQGARLVLIDLLEDELDTTVRELGGERDGVFGVPADLTVMSSVRTAADRSIELLSGVDGLVNAAGLVRHSDPLEVSTEDWEVQFRLHNQAAYELSRSVAKHLIAEGRPGSIVNVASEAGKNGHTESLAYSATKAALINETRMLSASLAHADINVNCICPGGLPTDMLRDVSQAYSERTNEDPETLFAAMHADQVGRHLELTEVARVISFLLSDDAFPIRGQAINVDAGGTPY